MVVEKQSIKTNTVLYHTLTDKLFYGVPLSEAHLNDAVEQIWKHLIDNGAGRVLAALQIGLCEHLRKTPDGKDTVVRRRLIFTGGSDQGRELELYEIENIGLFLDHSVFYKTLFPVD